MAVTLSKRYRVLSKRIHELKRNLLPAFSPTGSYSQLQLDRTMAFRLLVHAEIEAFLEDRAKSIVKKALSQWKNKQKISKVLLCLLAFSDKNWGGPPESIKKIPGEKAVIKERLDMAAKIYYSKLSSNHGIKEKNILQVLLPLGVEYDEIDLTWLNSMNSYGEKRGEVAHNSLIAISTIDPKTEWETVKKILLPGLQQIDKLLSKLL